MRILVVSTHGAVIGGAERYVAVVLRGLQRQGHSVALLHQHSASGRPSTLDGCTESVPARGIRESSHAAVLAFVRGFQPDVLYFNGEVSAQIEQWLLAEYPSVRFVHDYHWTCPTMRKSHSWPTAQACTRPAGPACLLLHYPRRCGGLSPFTMWRGYVAQRQRCVVLYDSARILVASTWMRDEIERSGVPNNRIRVLPPPLTGMRPDPEPPRPRPLSYQLLYVGRLVEPKGVSYLLEAVRLLHKRGYNMTLTVAGEGPDRTRLEQLSADLGSAVTFLGERSNQECQELMRNADLLAVPSIWPEPFGLVGPEAFCVGLPVVGYDHGGLRDWLIPGRTGELAPADPPTAAGLANVISNALADPGRHHEMRLSAWQQSCQYAPEEHVHRLCAELEQACTPTSQAHQSCSNR